MKLYQDGSTPWVCRSMYDRARISMQVTSQFNQIKQKKIHVFSSAGCVTRNAPTFTASKSIFWNATRTLLVNSRMSKLRMKVSNKSFPPSQRRSLSKESIRKSPTRKNLGATIAGSSLRMWRSTANTGRSVLISLPRTILQISLVLKRIPRWWMKMSRCYQADARAQ